jgi:hypothetical protein
MDDVARVLAAGTASASTRCSASPTRSEIAMAARATGRPLRGMISHLDGTQMAAGAPCTAIRADFE